MIPTQRFYIYRTTGAGGVEAQLLPWRELADHVKALLTDAQLDLERVGFNANEQLPEEQWQEIESAIEQRHDDQEGYNESVLEGLEFAVIFLGEEIVGFLFSTPPDQTYVASFLPLHHLEEHAVGSPRTEDKRRSILRRPR